MTAIYLVETPNEQRLVRANTRATAVNHVVKETIHARPVTADELLTLMDEKGMGIAVETAGNEAASKTVENVNSDAKDNAGLASMAGDDEDKNASIERIADEVVDEGENKK